MQLITQYKLENVDKIFKEVCDIDKDTILTATRMKKI